MYINIALRPATLFRSNAVLHCNRYQNYLNCSQILTIMKSSLNTGKISNDVVFALPLSRIRTIMKSSLNTGKISNDVLFAMSKAAELFVQNLTKETCKSIKEGDTHFRYEQLANFTEREKNLEFLLQIIPRKIKVKDFRRTMQNKLNSPNMSCESDEED